MSMTQIIYYSRNRIVARDVSTLETLRAILSVSQRNNQRDGITGFLILDRVWFMQILEGERAAVTRTYDRLSGDARHGDVTLMGMRTIQSRSFPRWSMGAALRSLDQTEIFLRHGIGAQIDPTKVTAPTVLALAMDLQDHEIALRQDVRAAG